jgi:hypothetical protein
LRVSLRVEEDNADDNGTFNLGFRPAFDNVIHLVGLVGVRPSLHWPIKCEQSNVLAWQKLSPSRIRANLRSIRFNSREIYREAALPSRTVREWPRIDPPGNQQQPGARGDGSTRICTASSSSPCGFSRSGETASAPISLWRSSAARSSAASRSPSTATAPSAAT